LIIHGDDDQICPIGASAYSGIKLLKKGTMKIYPGGAHALPNTEVDKLNQDILDFIETGTVKDKTQ
jgi:non-heme chloroperoxidase